MIIEVFEKGGGDVRRISATHVVEIEDQGDGSRVIIAGTGPCNTDEGADSLTERVNAARNGEVIEPEGDAPEPIA